MTKQACYERSQANTSYRDDHDRVMTAHSITKRKVLLLSSARSGSSYSGYLLASNPEVFYMYEPLSVYEPKKDYLVREDIMETSTNHGYKCINQPVSCRLDYLYSCQILLYFKEAYFRMPTQSARVSSWYGRIFAELQKRLNFNSTRAGLDTLCSDQFKIIAMKTIRVSYIEDVIPMVEKGLKVVQQKHFILFIKM